nr:MAG TPA: F-actin-capping protein subunit [Caudoviricetes sp.]
MKKKGVESFFSNKLLYCLKQEKPVFNWLFI